MRYQLRQAGGCPAILPSGVPWGTAPAHGARFDGERDARHLEDPVDPRPDRAEPVLPRPRDLLRVGPHDRAHLPAARVAVAIVVPMALLAATGHLAWVPYAVFGGFAAAFGRGLARGQRAGMQLEAGGLLVACVVLGTALSALQAPLLVTTLTLGGVAAAASAVADLRRWSPPGPLFPVFATGVCAAVPAVPATIGVAALVATASLALALGVGAAGLLLPGARRAVAGQEARGRRRPSGPVDARLVALHAGICLVAAVTAAGLSTAAGLEHPYWAMVSAVVPVVGRRTSLQLTRAAHRLVGTLLGVALAAGLLALDLPPVGLIVAFGVLQFGAELAVMRHYGLTLLFITPMALGMGALTGPVDIPSLVLDRAADTAIGVGVVVVLLLVTHRLRTAPRGTGA
ncbi:FUSC family protein [Frigoribacterium salinisoli]